MEEMKKNEENQDKWNSFYLLQGKSSGLSSVTGGIRTGQS